MLDKTDNIDEEVVLRPHDQGAPAIFVRMNSQVGPNRTMEMSFGIPLDMRPADLNAYVDKVAAVAERQNDKGILEQLKSDLREAYRRIEENLQHLTDYQSKQENDWYSKGRKGEWQPSGSESAAIKNFQTTVKNLRENVIPLKEKQIAEYEEKIRGS